MIDPVKRKYHKISFDMSGWDVAMLVSAVDRYVLDNMDMMDCSTLCAFADYLDEVIDLERKAHE